MAKQDVILYQSVEKTYIIFENGCLALLAMLVLHRAKLLASNQSVLALGVAPRQVAGTPVPVFSPFPGERGQGDRDSKLEVCFKNILFRHAKQDVILHNFPLPLL
ncbi:MAG: hypothetical protein EGR80_01370 [Ruminiclostridium sp.]|nr:hypothetical protein [Ruminiclostridium sp.]